MRLFPVLAAVSAIAIAAPAHSATYVLDFANTNCATTCGDGSKFLQSYGDVAGSVDLSYRSLDGAGNSTVNYSGLNYWDSSYGDLQGVIWGGNNDLFGVPEITFTALGPDGVTINSFDMAGWPNSDKRTDVRIYDLSYNLLYSSGPLVAPGQGHITVTPSIFSATGLILQWGPSGYNAGIDNLSFTVGPASPAVPEPSTWALMLAGFGAVGFAMRRRRTVAISYA